MLDRNLIGNAFVGVVKDLIGSRLSTLTNPSGTTPAVVKSREGGYKPDLPYVSVDVANFILPSGWLLHSYFDESNVMTYEVLYEIFVDFKCFGEDSQEILQEFHSFLSIPIITEKIQTDVFGASVQQQGDVINTPDLLSTDFEEGATLTTSFYIIDTIQDPAGLGVERILNVTGTGTIKTGVNGDITVSIDTQDL